MTPSEKAIVEPEMSTIPTEPSAELEVGRTYEVAFPFVLERGVELIPDDPEATDWARVDSSWRPGVEFDHDAGGNTVARADAMGAMLLTVVDLHRPGRFPTRVFFTRQWRDPTGKVFGKGGLRIMTVQAFKRRLRGYKHEFELPEAA